jgi:hypothetical protein
MPRRIARGSAFRRCRSQALAERVSRYGHVMTVTEQRARVEPWITRAAIGIWALAVLWLGSDAGFNMTAFLLTHFGGILLFGWWAVRLVFWFTVRRRSQVGESVPVRRHVLRWLWEPVTIVACWAVAYTGILFPARFAVSRPSLDRYVREVRERGDSTPPPGRIVGLFKVREVELRPDGVVRLITTSCMLDDCGMANSPKGQPPVIGEDSYRHLSGNWWHWFRSW